MDKEITAIRKQRSKWIAAINESNAAGFVSVLTDDAVWLPAMHNAIRGKKEIQAWLEKPFSELEYDYSVSEVRLRVTGDWAIEQAKFATRATAKSGGAMPLHEGMYTLIWRKTSAGDWLIERYIDLSADFMSLAESQSDD